MHQLQDRDWTKQDSTVCLQETHFNYKDTYKLKVNGEKHTVVTLVKTSRSRCVNFRQSRLQKQGKLSLIKKALHNDKGVGS